MFWHILWFELKFQLKQPAFYIYAIIFGMLAYGAMVSENVGIINKSGNILLNAPSLIVQLILNMSLFSVLITMAIVAPAIHRDFESNAAALFFTTPLKKRDYLGGRFAGSLLIVLAVYVVITAAVLVGSLTTSLDPERLGPFSWTPFAVGLFMFALPSVLITGAISFSIVLLTRSMLYTIIGHVVFFAGFFMSFMLRRQANLAFEKIANLVDPFAISTYGIATKYWTVIERNTLTLPDSPDLWLNRLIWIILPCLLLAYAYRKFDFSEKAVRTPRKAAGETESTGQPITPQSYPVIAGRFSSSTRVYQLVSETRLETLRVLKSLPFWAIMIISGLGVLSAANFRSGIYGAPIFPHTGLMMDAYQGMGLLFVMIVLIFYAGEIVWRERSVKLASVHDALPISTWLPLLAKFAALCLVLLTMILIYVALLIGIQLTAGYTRIEPLVYFKGIFILQTFNQSYLGFIWLTILALFFQILFNNRYVGMLAMTLEFIGLFILQGLGLEHRLFYFGYAPDAKYSELNGFGHFVEPALWYHACWGLASMALLGLCYLLWPRGTETDWKNRLKIARGRLSAGLTVAMLSAAIGSAGVAGFIYYNTVVLNSYITAKDLERQQAEFEQKYKQYEKLAMPTVTAISADVDLYPEIRNFRIRTDYIVQNKTAAPLDRLHITFNRQLIIQKADIPTGQQTTADKDNGYYIYQLSPALTPGDSLRLHFELSYEPKGFVNDPQNFKIVYNGTFLHSDTYFPHIGYRPDLELQDRNKRKQLGLPPLQRSFPLNDQFGLNHLGLFLPDAALIRYKTTVSTEADQIAIAPGYLEKEWAENGRKFFHYKMDAPVWFYFSYLSARYAVAKDKWTPPAVNLAEVLPDSADSLQTQPSQDSSVTDVSIEVYYHPAHGTNVPAMIAACKLALDYCSRNFSPYQFRQFRIIEFPGYDVFAEAFPNTIPYSEAIGFMMDGSKSDIDFNYFVTAHETGHQWWGHQVGGANVVGAAMMIETMAEYTGLMVMKKECGPDGMRKFLRYELDRYLRGRGREGLREVPLMYVEANSNTFITTRAAWSCMPCRTTSARRISTAR